MTTTSAPDDTECVAYVLAEALIRRALNQQDPHGRFKAWWLQAQHRPDGEQ